LAKKIYRTDNFNKYAERLGKLQKEGLRELGLAMVETVNLIRDEAHKNSPRDKGKLQDHGWKSGSGRTSTEITGFVLNDVQNEDGVSYASFTEDDPRGGNRAQHYLRNAAYKGMKELPNNVEKRMEKLLKKVK
jgi:hypothetical protein